MFPQFRPVQPVDFPECLPIVRNAFCFPDAQARAALLRLWKTLHSDGRMIGAVIEDRSAPAGARIAWACFKVFATDRFIQALAAGEAPPFFARGFCDAFERGEPLPLLTLPEIRRVNSGLQGRGLNMLVTHYGSPFVLGESGGGDMVAEKLLAFTEYFSSGYRARTLHQEFYDDYNVQLALNAGYAFRTDYNRHLEPGDPMTEGRRPRLLGATPEEVKHRPGTITATIMAYRVPRFHFQPAEQEMLLHALLGESDEALAERLHLAPVSIRKRWDTVYARVLRVEPGLFGEQEAAPLGRSTAADTAGPRRRGIELKRQLIAYLRHHMEELRPLEGREAASVGTSAAAG